MDLLRPALSDSESGENPVRRAPDSADAASPDPTRAARAKRRRAVITDDDDDNVDEDPDFDFEAEKVAAAAVPRRTVKRQAVATARAPFGGVAPLAPEPLLAPVPALLSPTNMALLEALHAKGGASLATELAVLHTCFPDVAFPALAEVRRRATSALHAANLLLNPPGARAQPAAPAMAPVLSSLSRSGRLVRKSDDDREQRPSPPAVKQAPKKGRPPNRGGRRAKDDDGLAAFDEDDSMDRDSVSGDEDEMNGSSDSDGGETSAAQRAAEQMSVTSFVNKATPAELEHLPRSNKKIAAQLMDMRPFQSWDDMVARLSATRGVNSQFVWNCLDHVTEIKSVEELMKACKEIAERLEAYAVGRAADGDLLQWDESKLTTLAQQPALLTPTLHLKPYQLVGVNWLLLLHEKDTNAILADEMGLGKTIQTIAFLAHLRATSAGALFGVIAPSSTIENWEREFSVWCPSLRVVVVRGSQQERERILGRVYADPDTYDVLLTSYNCAVSKTDQKLLRMFHFVALVFDEGHLLKNFKSQRYKALMRMKATRRVLLTGTPIQNNLLELCSILAFATPRVFRDRMEDLVRMFTKNSPDQIQGYENMVSRAKRLIAPFVLRRKKADVLNLPPKQIYVIYCPMPDGQRAIYDRTLAILREQDDAAAAHVLAVKAKPSGSTVARVIPPKIGNFIMRLRNLSNHALLVRAAFVDKTLGDIALRAKAFEPAFSGSAVPLMIEDMTVMSDFELNRFCQRYDSLRPFVLSPNSLLQSAKCMWLAQNLPTFKARGDRVLLFSQFTTLLDVLQPLLDALGHAYLRLDGQTPVTERLALIDRYNNDPSIFVFLLSTKAGGLGINLTAANIAILYDSSFNPSEDLQAIDRCHRMGQTRAVFVYRLVTQGTIEERILELATEKQKLENATMEAQAEHATPQERLDAHLLDYVRRPAALSLQSALATQPAPADDLRAVTIVV